MYFSNRLSRLFTYFIISVLFLGSMPGTAFAMQQADNTSGVPSVDKATFPKNNNYLYQLRLLASLLHEQDRTVTLMADFIAGTKKADACDAQYKDLVDRRDDGAFTFKKEAFDTPRGLAVSLDCINRTLLFISGECSGECGE